MTSEAQKLIELDLQVKRLVADRESDKRAHRAIHTDQETRIRALETHYAKASGMLIVISVLLQILLHFIKL